jgi:outer membrane lipoprotein-sorting protein
LAAPVLAQQNQQPPNAPPVIQRDPEALNIVNLALSAAGGAQAVASVQDFTATGTITYYWAKQEVGNVTLKGRGNGQFRMDAFLPEGLQTILVSNGTGSVLHANGETETIQSHNAINLGSLTFPFAYLLTVAQDSTISATYVGLETVGGRQVQHLHTQKVFPNQNNLTTLWSRLTTRDFYFDAASFQLVMTRDLFHPANRSTVDYVHEIQFADFRNMNGVLVPFSIEEFVMGQHRSSIQLDKIGFNSSLTDSDFKP